MTSEDEKNAIAQQLIATAEDLEIEDPNQVWSRIYIGEEILRDV